MPRLQGQAQQGFDYRLGVSWTSMAEVCRQFDEGYEQGLSVDGAPSHNLSMF